MGSTSQPGQNPSSPYASIIAEPLETAKLQVKGPQSNPFSLFAKYGTRLLHRSICSHQRPWFVSTRALFRASLPPHYPKAVMTRAGNCGFPPSPKSLSQRLHYLDSLRQSSLSNSRLREALGSTERDVRRRAIGSQAPAYENAHFGCTSIPISDVLSPTSRVLSDNVATRMRHYVASLS